MVRFDAYTATSQGFKAAECVGWICELARVETVREGRGFHTFGHRVSCVDDAGDEVGAVQWGGRQGDRVMVEVKGEATPVLVDRIRQADGGHRCTRVDSCYDMERDGAWDDLLGAVMAVKERYRLYGGPRGDWSFPELGRTQYLGASSSAVRARLYEKGKQPEFRHLARPNLVRLELQVRPQKGAKAEYSLLGPLEVWGASKWTRELAGLVLREELDPHPPGTVRKDSIRERAIRHACRQYGKHLVSLAADCGGWEVLGLTLREIISEEQERMRRTH